MPETLELVVNGQRRLVPATPGRSLLSVLREELGLTGAKPGCGEGACGACTVLVGGDAVRSCMFAIADVRDLRVTTIEGVAKQGTLHPLQQTFAEVGALQCGYCSPGMILSAIALLANDANPDERRLRAALDGNVCRCGAYARIERAVLQATERVGVTTLPPLLVGQDVPELARPRHPWDLVQPEDRDWFPVLGDGLVVVSLPNATGAWPLAAGAWMHVGADGSVTAFTGKVDVGQGTRTALAAVVARELGVEPASIRLMMGDTDLCPFDMGTFGSLSMPAVEPPMRAVAATARRVLDEIGVDARSVASSGSLRGVQRVEVVTAESTPRAVEVGESPADCPELVSRDRIAAVTGACRYPTDVSVAGMGYGAVLHAPSPGASRARIDLAGARAISDVVVIEVGDLVGVVAGDLATARRAIAAIDVTWVELPSPREADLGEYLRTHTTQSEGWGGASEHDDGDVDAVIRAAPVSIKRTYDAAYIAHVPLETRAAVAAWEHDRLTVWTGTQRPFGTRAALATTMGIDERAVRIIVPTTGAGFGGKHSPEVAIEAATLSRAAQQPVKVVWSREEEFVSGYLRPAAVIDIGCAASSDGDLLAWDHTNINAGNAGLAVPYTVATRREWFQPVASPLRQGSYRALAATVNNFARESCVDELAHELRIDPLELRLRNLRDDRLIAVIDAAADRFGWPMRSSEQGLGAGLAIGKEKGGRVATFGEVHVDPDGALEVLRVVTAFECGRIVSRDDLMNQIEGATVMGLGGALFEAVHFSEGRILNPHLSSYRVPRFSDVPPIDVVLVDRPDQPSAGAGETPIITIAPAIANAICAATGIRLRRMPLLPELERAWHGLRSAR
ncbi:MAG: molybdopterin cofactor-binding domain-containing protein [Acidimicrobiia bacterium]